MANKKIAGDHKITTFRQKHFTMVLIEMLDGSGKTGVGFSKYNPEDADRPQIFEGSRMYSVKTVASRRRTGKIKKQKVIVALKKKPWLFNEEIGFNVAYARAYKDLMEEKVSTTEVINCVSIAPKAPSYGANECTEIAAG